MTSDTGRPLIVVGIDGLLDDVFRGQPADERHLNRPNAGRFHRGLVHLSSGRTEYACRSVICNGTAGKGGAVMVGLEAPDEGGRAALTATVRPLGPQLEIDRRFAEGFPGGSR